MTFPLNEETHWLCPLLRDLQKHRGPRQEPAESAALCTSACARCAARHTVGPVSTAPNPYGPGQSLPRRSSGMTKAGKIMFFVGLVLSVLSLVAVVWGTTQTVRVAQNMMDDTITVTGDTTVPMSQGGSRMILTEGGQEPTCTVTAPDGSDVASNRG